MKNTSQNHAAPALAANFQVSELEPRLENAWAGGFDGPEVEQPHPGTTQQK